VGFGQLHGKPPETFFMSAGLNSTGPGLVQIRLALD